MPGRMLAGIFNAPLLRFTCGHLATGRIAPAVLNKDVQLSSTTSVEGMRRTLLDEHFRIKGREIKGKTPYAVFVKGLPKEKKVVAKTAAQTA